MKGLQIRVKEEYGIIVGYNKCWYARARAKMMLHGDGSDQYKRLCEYVAVVRKYNEESIALVGVQPGVKRPLFQSIFICLKPVLDGFLQGCRHIIGLDGVHSIGAYPGICLTVVAKVGNNNIFPLAWSVVDVERLPYLDLVFTSLRR